MRSLLLLTCIAYLSTTPSYAKMTLKQCIEDHNQCVNQCLDLETQTAKAGCVAKCAGTEAACVGEFGIQSTEPFIRKKADQLEKMIDDFFGDLLPSQQQTPEDESLETDT